MLSSEKKKPIAFELFLSQNHLLMLSLSSGTTHVTLKVTSQLGVLH